MKKTAIKPTGAFKCIRKGEHPSVLLLSGMHGDEFETIPLVSSYVLSHIADFPNFLYIPQVSPSAVEQKTRENVYGNDINRAFIPHTRDSEALVVMNTLMRHAFTISLDFHEDSAHEDAFYFYDTGEMKGDALKQFKKAILTTGVTLYSGVDDPEDPHLGCLVEDGYISKGHEKDSHESGFLTKWMAHKGIVDRAFTFEVPGKATIAHKEQIISAVFSYFMDHQFMVQ